MFDATARNYSKIQFEKINVDTKDPLCEKYQTTSIPRVVFLDGGGKVLYNGGAWGDPASFGEMIK